MPRRARRESRSYVLKQIFTAPFYILLTIVEVIIYYGIFYYLILASNRGIFLVTVPMYFIYVLILSSSVLLTTSIYAVSKSIRARYTGAEGGILSMLTSSVGGLVAGCNCYAPIISSVMYALGFGTLGVSSAISFLGAYQAWLVGLFVSVNLIFIYYQLGRITHIGGSAARR